MILVIFENNNKLCISKYFARSQDSLLACNSHSSCFLDIELQIYNKNKYIHTPPKSAGVLETVS